MTQARTWHGRAIAEVLDIRDPCAFRDGALLALLDLGVEPAEIEHLTAAHVRDVGGDAGARLEVRWRVGTRHTVVEIPAWHGKWVLAHLATERTWGERVPLFAGYAGRPLGRSTIHLITSRYRRGLSQLMEAAG